MPIRKYEYYGYDSDRNINTGESFTIDGTDLDKSDAGFIKVANIDNSVGLDYSSPENIPGVRATRLSTILSPAFTFDDMSVAKKKIKTYGKECAKAVTHNFQNLTGGFNIANLVRGDAWTKHMTASDYGYGYFSIYDDKTTFNKTNSKKRSYVISKSKQLALSPEFTSKIKNNVIPGTPVMLLYPGSNHYGDARKGSKGSVLSTHIGFIADIGGKKYVVDNVHNNMHYRPLQQVLSGNSNVVITGMIDYKSSVNNAYADISDYGLELHDDIHTNSRQSNLGGVAAYRSLAMLDRSREILTSEFGVDPSIYGFLQRAIPALMMKESNMGRLKNNKTFQRKNNSILADAAEIIKGDEKSVSLAQAKLYHYTPEELNKLGININELTEEQMYSPEVSTVLAAIHFDRNIKEIDKALGEHKEYLPDYIYETLIYQAHNQGLNNIKKNIARFNKSHNPKEFKGYFEKNKNGDDPYGVSVRQLANYYIPYNSEQNPNYTSSGHLYGQTDDSIDLSIDIEPILVNAQKATNKATKKAVQVGNKVERAVDRSTQKLENEIKQDYRAVKRGLSPVKKLARKLRFGWGGIMSQNSIMRDMIFNPHKYDLTAANFTTESNNNYASFRDLPEYTVQYDNHRSMDSILNSWSADKELEAYDHRKTTKNTVDSRYFYTDVSLDNIAIQALNNHIASQQATLMNMRNRIDDDTIKAKYNGNNTDQRVIQGNPIMSRYGGILRPRFSYGGYYSDYSTPRIPYTSDYSMNNQITASDIPDSKAMYGVEAIRKATMLKGAGTGAGIGASVGSLAGGIASGVLAGTAGGAAAGAAAGAASTAWIPVIGPLVALAAAGIGAGIGAGVSKNKADKNAAIQLMQNKQTLAQQAELNRQTSVGNAISRIDRDVYKIQNNQNNFDMNQGFYSKYGGFIGLPRRRYDMGGFIQPNSSDSVVAYGRTHEQMNPMTGETGVSYGNAEVEGGGIIGGIPQAGEVIRQSPMGDQVYTDSIVNPRTGLTYARDAKKLTDQKGRLEKQLGVEQATLEKLLHDLNTSKTLGARKGTQVRNAEKAAARMNLTTGMIVDVDTKLQNLFGEQEQIASTLGLRDTNPMRYGGRVVPRFDVGGWLAPTLSFAGNALTSGLQYWASSADAKYKQDMIDMMAARQLPKQTRDEAIVVDPNYDINSEINDARRDYRYMARFIRDNSTNPQQTRNLLAKARLDKRQVINQLKATKKAKEQEIINQNIASIIQTRNANRRKMYDNLMNEFNWNTQIQTQRMAVKSQQTQAIQQLLRDLGQSATQAAQMYVASKQWAPGVTRDMNGNVKSVNFDDMTAAQLKNHRYSNYVGRGADGKMIYLKNDLPAWFNKRRAAQWFEVMNSSNLFG